MFFKKKEKKHDYAEHVVGPCLHKDCKLYSPLIHHVDRNGELIRAIWGEKAIWCLSCIHHKNTSNYIKKDENA